MSDLAPASVYEMASVLFMDIVGYSLRSIDDQTELLTHLQNVVRESTEYNQASMRGEVISLAAGDGMALVFLRDPIAPARCALEIAGSLKTQSDIKVRMGLHMGPIRRHADIKEDLNVVGGGINTAQRVMDCGDAGHILLSRTVAEVLEQLRGWAGSIHDVGVVEIKHGVKLQLYNLCRDGLGKPAIPSKILSIPRTTLAVGRARARYPWLARSVAALLGLGIVAIAFWPTRPSPPPVVVPFATEFELQTMARWSPKGDRIAYVAPVNGILQVFTKTLGSTTPTQITRENESCLIPFWSADATRIYFIAGVQPQTNLRSIAVAGGQSELVLRDVYRADLSPDGKTLAVLVSDAPGSYRLAFSTPPGAAAQPYSRAPVSNFRTSGIGSFMRFDRSGRYLGVSVHSPVVTFFRIPFGADVREEPLGFTEGQIWPTFDWVDDGRRIIVDSFTSGYDDQLAITDIESKSRRYVTASASKVKNPSLSPSGHMLAFDSGESGYKIIEIPLNSSPGRDLSVTARSEAAPDWAPDGMHYAYATNRSGKPEVWLRNRVDGTERLIADSSSSRGLGSLLDCAISPDGTRIAFRSGGTILISPLTGEAAVTLWEDPLKSEQRGPSWSPDGNWIAYYGVREGRSALLKARVGANAAALFLAYMGAGNPVRWSPRGDWILFNDGEKLRAVSPEGKQDRVISNRIWETYGWSKDGATVYGVFTDRDRREVLSRVDLISTQETRIADIGPASPAFDIAPSIDQLRYRGFSLNPDGKSFLTSIIREKTQIYVMYDFDRPTRLIDRLF